MTYQEILDKIKPDFEKAVSSFREEIAKIRSSRLAASLIEDIEAHCFGSFLPLKQLGAISSPSLRQLALQLWDKSYLAGVIAAIEKADLGLSMRVDESTLYLTAPPLTEESRVQLVQALNKKKEEFFQNLRHLRDRAWKEMQDSFQAGELREDDKFKGRDKLDETARDYREKAQKMAENKEREIKG